MYIEYLIKFEYIICGNILNKTKNTKKVFQCQIQKPWKI